MFREMRRCKQQLPQEAAIAILQAGSSGVLAVAGDDGYPYAVPLSYAYHAGKIFFHCAPAGHKLDAIRREKKVSFCVIAQDDVVAAEFTTRYRSAIAFGHARILTEDAARRQALLLLAEKYSPGLPTETEAAIAGDWEKVCLVEIEIEHLTAKAARALL